MQRTSPRPPDSMTCGRRGIGGRPDMRRRMAMSAARKAGARACALLSLVLILMGGSAAAVQPQPTDASPPSEGEIVTAPVVLDGSELFRIRGVSSLPAADRAHV